MDDNGRPGGTPDVMESLEFVSGELKAVNRKYPYLPEMWPLLGWLFELRPQQITPRDAGFINEISEIMSGIRQSKQGLLQACGIYGACAAAAGTALCMFLLTSGIIGYVLWDIAVSAALFADLALIMAAASPYEMIGGDGSRRWYESQEEDSYPYPSPPRGTPSLERYLRRRTAYAVGAAWLMLLMLGLMGVATGDLWIWRNTRLGFAANLILYAIFGVIIGVTLPAVSYFDKKWRGVYTILTMWGGHRSE